LLLDFREKTKGSRKRKGNRERRKRRVREEGKKQTQQIMVIYSSLLNP
jgi:hypothetical protein